MMEVKLERRLEGRKPGAARILNRVVTVTEHGIEHEAGQWQAEITCEQSNGVVVPGVSASEKEEEKTNKEHDKFVGRDSTGRLQRAPTFGIG